MRTLIINMLIIISLGGCSTYSPKEVDDFLKNQSCYLITENKDTLQIEFRDSCLINYNWDHFLFNEWNVTKNQGSTYLQLNGSYFKIKSIDEYQITLEKDDKKIKLIKANNKDINLSIFIGSWIDAQYFYALSNKNYHEIPCPNPDNNRYYPGVEFFNDSCYIMDFCHRKITDYHINQTFGFISFGDYVNGEQWKILSITKDTLRFDARIRKGSELIIEKNKELIKYGG